MNTKCHFIDKNLHYDCEFRAQFYQGVKHFFVLSLLKYATKDSTLAEGVDTSQAPDKDLLEKEKATLKKLLPLVEKFVHEKSVLQVSWFVSELVPLPPPVWYAIVSFIYPVNVGASCRFDYLLITYILNAPLSFFLQVSVLYALQVFCHSHDFPKGTVKGIYTECD